MRMSMGRFSLSFLAVIALAVLFSGNLSPYVARHNHVDSSYSSSSSLYGAYAITLDAPGPEPAPEPSLEPEPAFEPTLFGECRTSDDCCFIESGVGCFLPRLNQGIKLCIAPTDRVLPNKVDGCLR